MSDQVVILLATVIPLGGVVVLLCVLWSKDRKALTESVEGRARAEAEVLAIRKTTEDAQKAFEAVAAEALKSNSTAFLDLAKRELERSTKDATVGFSKETGEVKKLVDPLQKALEKYEQQIGDMERRRHHAFGEIKEQLESVVMRSGEVAKQTEGLKAALTRPHVRGRWGEIQLKNCVELAGMSEYCDFSLQESSRNDDGALLRPDMIVKMPAGRRIAVDAKVSMAAFEAYIDARTDDERRAALESHGRHIRDHVTRLSRKEYWLLSDSPEFVVMFLPNESFLYAALETQPDLIESALRDKVLIASPPNLVGLLKVIYFGWHEQRLAQDAKRIADAGKELHKRIADLMTNFHRLDKALDQAREAYNTAAHNLNHKVAASARKLEVLGARSEKVIEELAVASLPQSALDAIAESDVIELSDEAILALEEPEVTA